MDLFCGLFLILFLNGLNFAVANMIAASFDKVIEPFSSGTTIFTPCTIQFKSYKIILLYKIGCVNSFLLLPNNSLKSVMQCQTTLMGCNYFPVNILLALFTYTFFNVNF